MILKYSNIKIKSQAAFIVATFITLTLLNACGVKIECPKAGGYINYVGYDSTEADSIKIYFYKKTSNFDSLIDSNLYTHNKHYFKFSGDTVSFNFGPFSPKNITSSDNSKSEIFDLKVVNIFDNKTTLLKDFTFKINLKNSGGFDPGTNHCQSPIISFLQDGVLITNGGSVFIIK